MGADGGIHWTRTVTNSGSAAIGGTTGGRPFELGNGPADSAGFYRFSTVSVAATESPAGIVA